MLSNLTLEATVMADNLTEDKIYCQNLRYSRLKPRLVAVSALENRIIMEVVVVDQSCKIVRV
jgi:hypothetical protein